MKTRAGRPRSVADASPGQGAACTHSEMPDEVDLNDIRRLDGGLLLVFRELLAQRRATDAARRLNLSQSAVSHALARLRAMFDDPLFIRLPHGLEPTQRAIELGPRVDALIELAGATLAAAPRFDPAHAQRIFKIATPEFINTIIGGCLVEAFQREAPRVAFVSRPLYLDQAVTALRRGEVDVALGQFARLPPDLVAEVLYTDRYCVIARQGHPGVSEPLDLETYARTPHIFVGDPFPAPLGATSHDPVQMARAYGELPDPAQVKGVAYVPEWETAMLIVATTDAIADCPFRLARRYAERLGLQVIEAPYKRSDMRPVQALRRAGVSDPGVDWLLEKLRSATA